MARRYIVFYGSVRLRGRDERRRAKLDLRRGTEPAKRYFTGKLVED